MHIESSRAVTTRRAAGLFPAASGTSHPVGREPHSPARNSESLSGTLGFLGILLGMLAGCAPPATMDLITVARKGLTMAQEAQAARHGDLLGQLNAQAAALDQAFDADVKLAAAGQIKDAEGKTVALTPDWVISARKGYAAARDAVSKQVRAEDALHAAQTDNLKTTDEALDMAGRLIVQQWAIGERIQQEFLNLQRRLISGR